METNVIKFLILILSCIGTIVSFKDLLKRGLSSLYLTYAFIIYGYIIISLFEPHSEEDFTFTVIYTFNFYLYEFITASILLIVILYFRTFKTVQPVSKTIKTLLVLTIFFAPFISDLVTAPLLILFLIVLIVLVKDYPYIKTFLRYVLIEFHFLDIIVTIFFISYIQSFNILDNILYNFLSPSSLTSKDVFQYRTAIYNSADDFSITANLSKLISLSILPYLSIYYMTIFLKLKHFKAVKGTKFILKSLKVLFFFIFALLAAFSTFGKARISYFLCGYFLSIIVASRLIQNDNSSLVQSLPIVNSYKQVRKKLKLIKFSNLFFMIIPFLIGFIIIQAMYSLTGKSDENSFLGLFLSRLLIVPVESNAFYFQIFPNEVEFQVLGNTFTRLFEPILNLFSISFTELPLESVVSNAASRQLYSFVASGFAMAYGNWGLLSPLVTLIFSLYMINIDILLHAFKSDTGVYTIYCYMISVMPVIVTVSYTYAFSNFGMCIIPLFFVFITLLRTPQKR